MPTTALTLMYDEVMPHANGCTPQMALDVLRKAAIEFCDQSWIHHHNHTDISVVANTHTYSLSPPTDTVVVTVLDAWLDNLQLQWKGSDDLRQVNTRWQAWTGPRPIYLTSETPRSVRLVPSPTVASTNGLRMIVALKPTIAAAGLETFIWEEYREQIADGALARLYLSPGKPYTNLELGAAKRAMFRSHCNAAYNRSMRAFGRANDVRFTLS